MTCARDKAIKRWLRHYIDRKGSEACERGSSFRSFLELVIIYMVKASVLALNTTKI